MENVTLAEVLRQSNDNLMARMNKAMPGRVTAYDPATQTAHVQPMLKRAIFAEDGTKSYEALPLLPHVPVLFPRMGGYVIVGPLSPGDFVWVMFSDGGLSEFLATGQESEPWDVRRHGLSGATCFPGCYPDTQPIADASTGGMVIGKDGSPGQIRIAPSEIKIGADASEYVALANLVQAALDTIATKFDAHTHLTTSPGNPTGTAGASTPPTVMTPLGPVAAAMTKAK